MKMKYLILSATFLLAGAGCQMNTQPVAQQQPLVQVPQPSSIAKQKIRNEYDFGCEQAKSMSAAFKIKLDPLLKAGNWEGVDGNGVSVCYQQGNMSDQNSILVKTSDCRKDQQTKSGWCTKAAVLLVNLKTKTVKVLVKENTNEMFANTVIDNNIIAWGENFITYRSREMFDDEGGCDDSVIKKLSVYEDKTVDILSAKISTEKSCRYNSCSDFSLNCTTY